MSAIRNFDHKADELKYLVRSALHEQRLPVPSVLGEPNAPAFEAAGFQHFCIDALLRALSNTDALDVLAELLDMQDVPADERPRAADGDLQRHAEKQGVSWADAWNHFRDQGYAVDHLEYPN